MIKFQEISGRDVFQYENFNLKISPGKHLIIGKNFTEGNAVSNGSGKSSIPETLDWVLFKKSSEGAGVNGMDISRDWKGGSFGDTKFFTNEHHYEIQRYGKAKGKDKSLDGAIKLFEDGEDISQRLPTHVDDEIVKLLGFDYDVATFTITVLQGLPNNFSTMMPTVRKGHIENLVGFSVWDDIKKLLDKFLASENNKKDEKSKKFQEERDKMVSLNSRYQALKESNKAQKDKILEDVIKLKQELFIVLTSLDKINGERLFISYDFLGKEETEKRAETTKLFGANILGEANHRINSLDKENYSLTSRANELNRMLSTKICPTCYQPYPDDRILEAEKEVTNIEFKKRVSEETKSIVVKIRDKLETIEKEDTKLTTTQNMLEKQINSLAYVLNKDDSGDLAAIEGELTQLTATVNLINDGIAEIDKEIANLTYLADLLRPSSKFRSSTLDKYLTYLNSEVLGRICPIILDNIEVRLVISTDKRGSGVDIRVTKDGKVIPYKSRSGGEKRRIDISLILALQRFLLEIYSVSTNLLFFDEIMDPLDSRGVETVLNCIDILFPQNMAIYIITHVEGFKDLFDDVITIVKKEEISRIEGGS